MKEKAIICDLDGTLCDSSWRKHFVEGEQKNWKAFYAGISADPVRYDVLRLLLSEWSERGAKVVFVTGRGAEYQGTTAEWLIRHVPTFRSNHLWMRDRGDHRPDMDVKRELIREVMEEYEVVLAFEDRPHIVEMIRNELGIECIDVGEK